MLIKGSILIDGVDVRDMNITDLRSLMGIVSQHPILFNASFAEIFLSELIL